MDAVEMAINIALNQDHDDDDDDDVPELGHTRRSSPHANADLGSRTMGVQASPPLSEEVDSKHYTLATLQRFGRALDGKVRLIVLENRRVFH